MMSEPDTLRRFIFEHAAIRGEFVHLDATLRAVLDKHEYPGPLKAVLGELMAAVALLSATMKYEGRLVAQVQGSGPVSLVVVDSTNSGNMRAVAHWNEQIPDTGLQDMMGDGRLVISMEPSSGGERYQGIVELCGETLSDALTEYLMRSEQLEKKLWLACGGESAAGLLIQKLPQIGEAEDSDQWNRVGHLAATVKPDELLRLDAQNLIHRLFYEEDVRMFEADAVCFRCSCSQERVVNMLRSLGSKEVNEILLEQDEIEVACEFCNHKYRFDAVDVEQFFASDIPAAPSDKLH